MANAYNTLQSGLIYQLFFNKTFETPTGLYVGLFSNAPTNTSFTEVSNGGNNYNRLPCGVSNGTGNLSWTFPYSNSGLVYNQSPITFPLVTGGDWGYVSGVGLFDSAVYGGGSWLLYSTLPTAKYLAVGDQGFLQPSGILARIS